MRRGAKHQNQFQIVFSDFSGGLNTSAARDGIAENQLTGATNVEVDHSTGALRTVSGTIDLLSFKDIFAALYDGINKKILLVKKNRKVYVADLDTGKAGNEIGSLSGELYPIAADWEDGILIASGGKLQYFNGEELSVIETSPLATSVYVRAGRILATDATSIRYSGVGDEETWVSDTDDASSGMFVEAGYKDGGKLVGIVNLSGDVLLIKDNRRVYRLNGEFPSWSMYEVSRNIEVAGRLGICAVADSVFVLGINEVQNISTTSDYGDMKPTDVAILVTKEIQNLSRDAILRYVPPLKQIWAISGENVLMFDLVTQGWYKRQFNSSVVDVIPVGNDVFVIKTDRVSKLDEMSFSDSDAPLAWNWQARRLISHYDYFVKRTSVSVSPITQQLYSGQVRVGAIVVDIPPLRRRIENERRHFTFSKGEPIYKNYALIYGNPQPIYSRPTIVAESRNVYRSKFLDVGGRGTSGGVVFNSVTIDLVEV